MDLKTPKGKYVMIRQDRLTAYMNRNRELTEVASLARAEAKRAKQMMRELDIAFTEFARTQGAPPEALALKTVHRKLRLFLKNSDAARTRKRDATLKALSNYLPAAPTP